MKLQNSNTSKLGWILLALLYGAIFLTIMALAYTGHLASYLTKYDKLGHVVLYFLATYLGHRALGHRRIQLLHYRVPLFPLLFGLFTTVEEGVQSFSPHRSLDAGDLIASFVGIGLGYWLAERDRKRAA